MSASTSEQSRPKRHWWNPYWDRTTWTLFFIFIVPVILGMVWIKISAGGQSSVDAATQQLASQLAHGPVQAFRGTNHTVYQATGPLPTTAAPRADGLSTLVWMSGANCGDCNKMDSFAWDTLEQYASRVVIVEKDLSRQPIDARYGVQSAPAFVLLSPTGETLAEFAWQPDAASLKTAIDKALESLPASP